MIFADRLLEELFLFQFCKVLSKYIGYLVAESGQVFQWFLELLE